MKRRRTKTSSIIDALTHLEWKHLPIDEALQLFSALEQIRLAGTETIRTLARQIAQPVAVFDGREQERPYPGAPPQPRSGIMNGQMDHAAQAARLCSACGQAPLNAEMPGPWLMNGLCQNCFDTQ